MRAVPDEKEMDPAPDPQARFAAPDGPISDAKLLAALRALMNDEAAISRKLTMRLMEEISHGSDLPALNGFQLADLSMREVEILRELASDATNQEIAERLSLSVPTVKHYIHRVLVRLQLKNRKEAARFARLEGLGGVLAGQLVRIKV